MEEEKEKKNNNAPCMACECPCEVHTEHTHGDKPGKICVGCGHKQESTKACQNCPKK